MCNSLPIRLLMIFALLFAQLGGLKHGISHVLAGNPQRAHQPRSNDHSTRHEKHCDLCDAYAQIANAIGSSIVSFAPCLNFSHIEQSLLYCFFSVASVPFAARAPPYSA
ncbi:MAG: hypothetical protein WB870_09280 [Gallionellaceae bacterium]